MTCAYCNGNGLTRSGRKCENTDECKKSFEVNSQQYKKFLEKKKRMPRMNVETIKMSKERAKELWKEYCEVNLKSMDYKHAEELKKCYYYLSKGYPIINIYDTFERTGLNEKGEPMLAIAPLNEREILFHQNYGQRLWGGGTFYVAKGRWNQKTVLEIPQGIFADNNKEIGVLKAQVPLVPPKILKNSGYRRGLFVLWEVKDWEIVPKDPFLLRKISDKMYAILGAWDLTKLERSILK